MLGHLEACALINHAPVLQCADDREQYRRSANPELFVTVPQVFDVVDFQAAEFSTNGIDGRFDVSVIYRVHGEKVSGM